MKQSGFIDLARHVADDLGKIVVGHVEGPKQVGGHGLERLLFVKYVRGGKSQTCSLPSD